MALDQKIRKPIACHLEWGPGKLGLAELEGDTNMGRPKTLAYLAGLSFFRPDYA